MNIGENIKNRRLALGITAQRMAERLGVAKVMITHWEHGHCYPNLYNAWDLADFFGCSIDELAGRKGGTKTEREIAKQIIEDISEALTLEMYKASKHKQNRTEEAKQQGARAALNKVFSILAELEKEYTNTEREGTDNGTNV